MVNAQNLRELDPRTFERFCFHLLKEKYPGVEIRRVEGSGGDEGVDLFQGRLDVGCVVWQCKAFPNGVGKSQKAQIKNSLQRAITSVRPVLWVLCLSVDFDIRTHRWWQKLQESYSERVRLELLGASELAHQLIFHRKLLETFFPKVIMDVVALRSALAQNAKLTTGELASLCADNVAQFIDRLSDCAPRFAYEVIFHPNAESLRTPTQAGLLFQVSDGQKAINVFARDAESIMRDPPTAKFKVQGTSASRLLEFLETGKPVQTTPGDLVAFSSEFDFLLPDGLGPVSEWRLKVEQKIENLPKYLFRVTFGGEPGAVIYDLISFQTVRLGQKEAELRSVTGLPFEMTLVVNFGANGNVGVHFSEKLAGAAVTDIQRWVTAMAAMVKTGECDLYDLESGTRFLRFHPSGNLPDWVKETADIANVAVKVGSFYHMDLRWPNELARSDVENLRRLHELISGVSMPLQRVLMKLTKLVQLPKAAIQEILKPSVFCFDYPSTGTVTLFGKLVAPGPLKITIHRGHLRNPASFAKFMHDAPIGSVFNLDIRSPMGAIVSAVPRAEP
jgi:hypothetical protein